MRSEENIRKQIKQFKDNKITKGPYSEQKIIAWNATIQALEWVFEETENPLIYKYKFDVPRTSSYIK
jgi:hypothetical protein